MNVKITLIGVYSQGKLFGAPSCVLFIPTALTNDQSSTLRIELGLANKFYVFFKPCIFSHCLAIFIYYLSIKFFITLDIILFNFLL